MSIAAKIVAAAVLGAAAAASFSQVLPAAAPQNVLQLAASGTVEVQQDLLHLRLTTSREGADPATVQAQLKAALEAALAEARKAAQPGQMEARSGAAEMPLPVEAGKSSVVVTVSGTVQLR